MRTDGKPIDFGKTSLPERGAPPSLEDKLKMLRNKEADLERQLATVRDQIRSLGLEKMKANITPCENVDCGVWWRSQREVTDGTKTSPSR